MSLPARFFSKVAIGEAGACWEWQAAVTRKGYGWFSFRGKAQLAHRLALEDALGRAISHGALVCHHCDNRRCVNPGHLYEGTALDNARDLTERGRVYGERHHSAKLSDAEVEWARSTSLSQASAAKALGVTQSLISRIRNNHVRRRAA